MPRIEYAGSVHDEEEVAAVLAVLADDLLGLSPGDQTLDAFPAGRA